MKALVIGFGSIGQRHARILTERGDDVAVLSRREINWANCFVSIESALSDWAPDLVVIASRTIEHFTDLSVLAANEFKGTVIVEKPLFHTHRPVPDNKFKGLYVGYNLRFHPVIEEMRKALSGRKILAAIGYVGQYLPQWRPQQDYRKGYSAHSDQGGGVLRELSHDLDFMNWLTGPWCRVSAIGGHFSHLEIEADDVFTVLLETEHAPSVTLHMNFLDDQLHREITILTDTGTIRGDLIKGTLEVDGRTRQLTVDRDETFVRLYDSVMSGEMCRASTSEEGLDILKLIDAAEQSSKLGVWLSKKADDI